MHYRTLLSFLLLAPIALAQTADEPTVAPEHSTSEEAEFPPDRPALSGVRDTIAAVDAQFRASQAEVLGLQGDDEDEEDAFEEGPELAPGVEAEPRVTPAPGAVITPARPNDNLAGEVFLDFGEEVADSAVARSADTISVDFPNENVRTIIRNVADLYDLNVVIPETLIGSVSLKLRDVTWNQVFDVVLEPLKFTWVEVNNIIMIRSQADLLAEPVATRVFVINFAQAEELQGAIAPLVEAGAGGRLQVDVRSNALVITERPSRMNDIQAIIERLDRPTDQVMIESKFVEITRRDQRNLGINWSSLSGYQLGAGPFQRQYDREGGRVVERGSTFREGTVFDPVRGEFQTDFEDTITDSVDYPSTLTRLDTAVFSADSFNVILSALETNNEVQLVSNPTVVTVNNTTAQINIGEEYPIPNYVYNQERGTFEVNGFEFKPIGILLNVTPQVNSAGFINLNIAPEISSRGENVNFQGANIPIVTTRKTESTVTIKSGFTLAIGGLVQQSTGDTINKVPLLGDIPLLGRLFKSTEKGTDSRNLIIFITAKVLNPDGSTYREVFSDRTLFEMGVSDKDVPGYKPNEQEQALYDQVRQQRDEIDRLKSAEQLRRQLQMLERMREQTPTEADSVRTIPRRNQP